MESTSNPFTRRLALLGWAAALFGLANVAILLLAAVSIAVGLIPLWVGIPGTVAAVWCVRRYADGQRWAFREALGVPIDRPYRPWPEVRPERQLIRLIRESATWRDLWWLLINSTLGYAVYSIILGLFASMLFYLAQPLIHLWVPYDVGLLDFGWWKADSWAETWLVVPLAVPFGLAWWFWSAPILRWYARIAASVLSPPPRRPSKDPRKRAHEDLVALGMSPGMAAEILDSDPDFADKLLALHPRRGTVGRSGRQPRGGSRVRARRGDGRAYA